MRQILLFLMTFSLIISPLRAQVDDFIISIWPEYDHEGILVIFNGTLSENAELPLELSFRVPAGVHNLLAMGTAEDINATTQLTAGPDNTVSISVKHPNFQLEYYDHAFSGDVNTLDFDFSLPFPVARSLEYYVQEPLAARDFALGFEADEIQKDRHGLNYHVKRLGPAEAETVVNISFSYMNPAKTLSMDRLREMMGQAGGSQNAPGSSVDTSQKQLPTWIWILVLLIILTLLSLGIILKPAAAAAGTEKKPAFCRHCGAAVQDAGMKFCSSCGTELKN